MAPPGPAGAGPQDLEIAYRQSDLGSFSSLHSHPGPDRQKAWCTGRYEHHALGLFHGQFRRQNDPCWLHEPLGSNGELPWCHRYAPADWHPVTDRLIARSRVAANASKQSHRDRIISRSPINRTENTLRPIRSSCPTRTSRTIWCLPVSPRSQARRFC